MPDDSIRGLPIGPGVKLMLDFAEENPWYYTMGTSFPPYPRLWEQCFRTDIRGGMMFRWNGVYWLSEQLFTAEPRDLDAISASATYSRWAVPSDYSIYLVRIDITVHVAGTNNGTNYWSYTLQGADGAIHTNNTSGLSGSVDYAMAVVIGTLYNPSMKWLYNVLTKVNAPGNLYMSWTYVYRLRAT